MAMTLITTNTESGDSESVFSSGIDSTYKLYIFKFHDINPATDGQLFRPDFSVDGGSNYGLSKTTGYWRASHTEADATTFQSGGAADGAPYSIHTETGTPGISAALGNGSDESCSGTLWLFDPSNTTFHKNFRSDVNSYDAGDASINTFVGGCVHTTSAINCVKFMMGSGDFDGVITMYGVGE